MRKNLLFILIAWGCQAQAAVAVFSDKASFISATAASQATAPYTDTGFNSFTPAFSSIVSGSVTFSSAPHKLYMGDASTRLPGAEITIDNTENLNVALVGSVHAMGFDFVEPQTDPLVNAAFVDSTFTVTLLQGAAPVGVFTFNAHNDSTAFVGVWSTLAFNRAEIRETVGGAENEFYGQFYTGTLAPVPEPATAVLSLLGLVGVALRCWRFRA